MIPLSNATKIIKNSLTNTGAWLVLLTLKSKDESVTLRLCSNTDNITFQTQEFIAFPFQVDEITESNKGELPSISITMSNVERLVQAYVEQDETLGSGWSVHIDIVHTSTLLREIDYDFITTGVSADEASVVFTCGMQNPLRYQFPRVRMLPNACQHQFKKGGCTYAGSDVTCKKTLADCRAKFSGAARIPILAFPGIPTVGIYR